MGASSFFNPLRERLAPSRPKPAEEPLSEGPVLPDRETERQRAARAKLESPEYKALERQLRGKSIL